MLEKYSVRTDLALEVYRLANIKSAKKRILVNETKAAKNKAIKSRVKTSVKKVEAAVAQKDMEAAKTAPNSMKYFQIVNS